MATLYPPIIASSMPAFDATAPVKVYFNLPNYNSLRLDNIVQVHASVRHLNTNASVVKSASQILIKNFTYDEIIKQYYIEINPIDISTGDIRYTEDGEEIDYGFTVGALYKIQLRLSSVGFNVELESLFAKNYFLNDVLNLKKFSLWSTVCILKPIILPTFYINLFYKADEDEELIDEYTASNDTMILNLNYFTYPYPEFTGVYNAGLSGEVLKSWRARLLKSTYLSTKDITEYTLADTGWKIANAYNYDLESMTMLLDCNISYELLSRLNYKLMFEIETKNGYKDSIIYTFKYFPQSIGKLKGKFTAAVNEEEGYVKLQFNSNKTITSNLCIRRTDSRSNFLVWEDLKNFEAKRLVSCTYYDFTALSGIAYRYLIQRRDARGRRGTPLYEEASMSGKAIICEWLHPMLLETNIDGMVASTKQLKLKFDFQISSWKTNISESKTLTIGSKYPFIRRNGNMCYRSFPCTGTITAFMDNADLFTSEEELQDENALIYKDYQKEEGYYSRQYDYTYERKFREKVEAFLCNSRPKLYKSRQEGNLLIKLMLVSLTPKMELDRLVYSFSATAYEIDLATIKNYNKHGIIDVSDYNPKIEDSREVFSQLNSYNVFKDDNSNVFKAGLDILGTDLASPRATNSIANKQNYGIPVDELVVNGINLNWLRITIESLPYLIGYDTSLNKYVPIENNINNYVGSPPVNDKPIRTLYQILSEYKKSTNNYKAVYLGTLLTINDKQIIVAHPNNIYEIGNDNLLVERIIPAKDTAMTIDYRAELVFGENLENLPRYILVKPMIGQIVGTYDQNSDLVSFIKYKYYQAKHIDPTFEQETYVARYINGVNTARIDTEPGAVIWIKTADNDNSFRMIVNETGEFNFDPQDSTLYIESLKVMGMNVPYTKLNRDRSMDLYDLQDDSLDLSHIKHPAQYDYCYFDNNYYVYYKGKWATATKEDVLDDEFSFDIRCPVDIIVTYYAVLRRDIY